MCTRVHTVDTPVAHPSNTNTSFADDHTVDGHNTEHASTISCGIIEEPTDDSPALRKVVTQQHNIEALAATLPPAPAEHDLIEHRISLAAYLLELSRQDRLGAPRRVQELSTLRSSSMLFAPNAASADNVQALASTEHSEAQSGFVSASGVIRGAGADATTEHASITALISLIRDVQRTRGSLPAAILDAIRDALVLNDDRATSPCNTSAAYARQNDRNTAPHTECNSTRVDGEPPLFSAWSLREYPPERVLTNTDGGLCHKLSAHDNSAHVVRDGSVSGIPMLLHPLRCFASASASASSGAASGSCGQYANGPGAPLVAGLRLAGARVFSIAQRGCKQRDYMTPLATPPVADAILDTFDEYATDECATNTDCYATSTDDYVTSVFGAGSNEDVDRTSLLPHPATGWSASCSSSKPVIWGIYFGQHRPSVSGVRLFWKVRCHCTSLAVLECSGRCVVSRARGVA